MAKKKVVKITDQELADARLMLALEILDSENAPDIIDAMHSLVMLHSARALYSHKKGNKKGKRQAQKWKHSADEFFTVVMCAIYQNQDANSDGGHEEDL
jgi:hypothetical protein